MRVESLLVYPPVLSRWLPALATLAFIVLLAVVVLLGLAGIGASGPLLAQAPDESIVPFRWG